MKKYKQLNASWLNKKIAPAIIQHNIKRDIGLIISNDAIYEFYLQIQICVVF